MGELLEALSDFAIQAELWGVSSTLRRIRQEQWLAATEIVAGLDSVREAVDELMASVDRQTRVLEQGFATLDARLDFQAYLLGDIRHTLKRPIETQALESRDHAQDLMRERYYDEALTELQKALSTYAYDFTSHFAVAAIRFEYLDDHEGAWQSCEQALRYAKLPTKVADDPTPAFYSSLARLLMARISEARGSLDSALAHCAEACLASPDYGDCFRHYARVAARLGRVDLALPAISAAIMVDVGQAVLIEQDDEFRRLGAELQRILSSIRDDARLTASRLSDLAKEALTTYQQASDKCWKLIASTTDIASLVSERTQAEESVARAAELERRGGLLDLARATRGYWWSICDLASQAAALQSSVQQHAESSEHTMRNSGASFEAEAGTQAELLSLEEQKKSSGRGCGLAIMLTFPLAAVAFFIESFQASSQDAQAFRILAVMVTGLFLLFLLVFDIGGRPSPRQRELSAKVGELRGLARQKELEVKRLQDNARGVLAELTVLTRISAMAAQAMASPELQCSLTLLDSGAKQDEYDEAKLAKALVDISRQHTDPEPLSLAQAKDVIRDCPRVFVSAVSVPDAEAIAAYLRRQFNASVGIKRRYVGVFPPQPKAIEGHLPPT